MTKIDHLKKGGGHEGAGLFIFPKVPVVSFSVGRWEEESA